MIKSVHVTKKGLAWSKWRLLTHSGGKCVLRSLCFKYVSSIGRRKQPRWSWRWWAHSIGRRSVWFWSKIRSKRWRWFV